MNKYFAYISKVHFKIRSCGRGVLTQVCKSPPVSVGPSVTHKRPFLPFFPDPSQFPCSNNPSQRHLIRFLTQIQQKLSVLCAAQHYHLPSPWFIDISLSSISIIRNCLLKLRVIILACDSWVSAHINIQSFTVRLLLSSQRN